ncbi:hypothetical protein [Acetobacter malorum]|nr:hypothetical protein [Acetobacter malorum]
MLRHKGGAECALTFRDAVNKIILATRYVWHADNLAALQVDRVGED